jgi:hypothetical protein
LTGDGTYTYQWDAEGRLKSVNNGALLAAPPGFGHGTEGRPSARRSRETPCTQKPGWSVEC